MYNNELYHFGVKGMKWGVRKAERKAERAAKRQHKNEAYKQKLAMKAQRRSAVYKSRADEAARRAEDLKKRGAKSESYRDWKEKRTAARRDAYNRRHRVVDEKGNVYYTGRYDSSWERMFDDLDDSFSAQTTIHDLINKNNAEAARYTEKAKRWAKNKRNLMNMSVTDLTKKSEIRTVYRG
jgi:hypothetical protein